MGYFSEMDAEHGIGIDGNRISQIPSGSRGTPADPCDECGAPAVAEDAAGIQLCESCVDVSRDEAEDAYTAEFGVAYSILDIRHGGV